MGVITVTDIDYGHIFGPFPSHVTPADPAYLIGMLTNDKRPEGLMLKMDPAERREGLRSVDWLPYIQPARDSEEQNMEAYVKEGQVYFRALRIIKAGEEMLVWYSKDFAQLLNIPELPRVHAEEGDHYICPRCGDTFDFPYSLRAHIKFKCSYTLGEMVPRGCLAADTAGFSDSDAGKSYRLKAFSPPELPKSKSSTDTKESTKDSETEADFPRPGKELDFSKPVNGLRFPGPAHGIDFAQPENGLDFSKPGNSADFTKAHTTVDVSKPYARYSDSRPSLGQSATAMKRPSGDSSPFRQASSPKTPRVLEPKAEMLSPTKEEHSRMLSRLERSPRKTPPETALKDAHSDVASAFRKVERSSTPEAERPSSSSSSSRAEESSSLSPGSGGLGVSMPASVAPAGHAPPASSMSRLSGPSSTTTGLPAMPGSLMGLYMPRLPMVPPPLSLPGGPVHGPIHPVSAHHPAFAAADQIPPGLLEMCRATIPSIGPLTESFANVRNGDSHGPLSGKGLFLGGPDRGGRPPAVGLGAVPFMKSNNPMVEKILQSTSPTLMASPLSAMNLSQNWCAKCNATFRMTSDLVYHMRSHHKREFDPMKRKREEKLKCTICNEAFRERHHLTRHMSSHA